MTNRQEDVATFRFPRDVRGWLTQPEGERLAALAQGRNVLELGSYCGRSTICLAQTASGVTAVDWHKGDPHSGRADTLAEFTVNLARYGVTDRVDVRVGQIEDVVGTLPPASFDLIFLDAAHDEGSVRHDLAKALPLLRTGGTLACHDYANGDYPGVRRAVDDVRRARGWRISVVDSLGVVTPRPAVRPLVSVITPTCGRPAELRRAVESVARQTYPNIEHIVIGDGESPGLPERADLRQFETGRQYGRQEDDYGATPRLAATLLARGDYLAYLDDDNEFLPDHVASLVDRVEADGVDFVYARMRRMNLDTGEVFDEVGDGSPRHGAIDTNMILHAAHLLRRATWQSSGYAADWDLVERWMRAGATHSFLNRVTVNYHWGGKVRELREAAEAAGQRWANS